MRTRFYRIMSVLLVLVMLFSSGQRKISVSADGTVYTLVLHSNVEGKEETISYDGADGSSYSLNGLLFQQNGKIISSWNTQADGQGTSYQKDDVYQINGNADLYAQWTPVWIIYYFAGQNNFYQSDFFEITNGTASAEITDQNPSSQLYLDAWNTNPDGSGIWFEKGQKIELTTNIVLYAQYVSSWHITYYKTADETDGIYSTLQYRKGEGGTANAQVSASYYPKSGYTFIGWNTSADGQGTFYKINDSIELTADLSLYPQYAKNYSITYHSNDGLDQAVNQNVVYGQSYQAQNSSFSREHYELLKWNTQPDGSGTDYLKGSSYTYLTEGNTDLYAIWGEKVTLKYDANGAAGSMPDYENLPGTDASVEQAAFSYPGKTFVKWNTKADGSGTSYFPMDKVTLDTDMTLYAQWADAFSLTYYSNTGEGTEYSMDILRGAETTLDKTWMFSKQGYSLTGWNTKADGSGTAYKTTDQVLLNGDLKLYAQWTVNHSIVFHSNIPGQTYELKEIQELPEGIEGELSSDSFPHNGSTVISWNTKPDGTGTSYPANASIVINADLDLYAQWSPSWKITFQSNHPAMFGMTDTQDIEQGKEAKLKDSYFFVQDEIIKEWNTAHDGSGTSYALNAVIKPESDMTLYAQWSGMRIIKFNVNDPGRRNLFYFGVSPLNVPVNMEDNGFPDKQNSLFASWNTMPDGSGDTYLPGREYTISDNIELYAQWEPAVAITYYANDGTLKVASDKIKPQTDATFIENTFQYQGYTFKEWNTKADGTGTSFLPKDTMHAAEENLDLYAVWTKNAASDPANPQPGTDPAKTVKVVTGDNQTVAQKSASANGLSFVFNIASTDVKAVFINGKQLVKDQDYTLSQDSTKVNLTKNYLDRLTPGTYDLTVSYGDQSIGTSTFRVIEKDTVSPDTGVRSTSPVVWGMIMISAFAACFFVVKLKRKFN